MKRRKIAVVVSNRSEYSRLKAVIKAIENHPGLELMLFLTSACLLEKYGDITSEIKEDGVCITEELYTLIDGGSNLTMAKTTGILLMELAQVFNRVKPDIAIVMGDRFEALSVSIAAAFLNIHVAHIQGGEVTGTIDGMIRHAITKFSHIHFPSNNDAAERIYKLGEKKESIFTVGCPFVDIIKSCKYLSREELLTKYVKPKDGRELDMNSAFLLVVQHPVTTDSDHAEFEIIETLKAIEGVEMQTLMFWPNPDAGSNSISLGIRHHLLKHPNDKLFMYKNVSVEVFLSLIKNAACIIGNSSSGTREACYLGIPAVNIGDRQKGRLSTRNVMNVPHEYGKIKQAILSQLSNGQYPVEKPYGSGGSAQKIADLLANADLSIIQKGIRY